MMAPLALLFFSGLLSLPAQATEPQNPSALCERFLEGPERTDCEKKMQTLKPDWYLATICNSNFDDKLFYECVELSSTGTFSPEKLEECKGDQYSDPARILCVKNARTATADKAFQDGAPKAKTQSAKKKKK